jgi:hypothetical protein
MVTIVYMGTGGPCMGGQGCDDVVRMCCGVGFSSNGLMRVVSERWDLVAGHGNVAGLAAPGV